MFGIYFVYMELARWCARVRVSEFGYCHESLVCLQFIVAFSVLCWGGSSETYISVSLFEIISGWWCCKLSKE
jgi:hypothetical protein